MTHSSWKIVGFVLLFVAVSWLALLALKNKDDYRPYDVVAVRTAGEPPMERTGKCSSCTDAPVYNPACLDNPCGTAARPCTHTVKCNRRAPLSAEEVREAALLEASKVKKAVKRVHWADPAVVGEGSGT